MKMCLEQQHSRDSDSPEQQLLGGHGMVEDVEDDEYDNKEEDEGEEEDSIGVDKDGDLQTIDIGELGILDFPAKADLEYVYNNIDKDKSINFPNVS